MFYETYNSMPEDLRRVIGEYLIGGCSLLDVDPDHADQIAAELWEALDCGEVCELEEIAVTEDDVASYIRLCSQS